MSKITAALTQSRSYFSALALSDAVSELAPDAEVLRLIRLIDEALEETHHSGEANKMVQPVIGDAFFICDAYESGFGHGVKNDGLNDGSIFADSQHGEAYELGYAEGLKRSQREKHVSQEPVAYCGASVWVGNRKISIIAAEDIYTNTLLFELTQQCLAKLSDELRENKK